MRTVATALGEVPIDQLGRTLTHEHLFINLMAERRGDGLLHDEELLIDELQVLADQGGQTIFDLTASELTVGATPDSDRDFTAAPGQTRNPRAVEGIQRISRATGVNVVLGAGRYRDPYLREEIVAELGVEGIAAEMIRDLTEGIPGTTARAGLIGEIGADKWYVSETEAALFRGAAAAHAATGAVVYTHAARWHVGLEQVELLVGAGVAPEKIVVGHVDTVPTADFAARVAATGAYVGIDTINTANPREVRRRIDQILELVRLGYLERILVAHDVCTVSQLAAYGGNGFGFVLGDFRTALIAAGLDAAEFEEIVVGNPRRLLS